MILRLDRGMPSCHAVTARSASLVVAVLALLLSGCSSAGSVTAGSGRPRRRPPPPSSAGRPDRVGRCPLLRRPRRLLAASPTRRCRRPPVRPVSRPAGAHHDRPGTAASSTSAASASRSTPTRSCVSVGLAPATRADLPRLPGRAGRRVGDAARVAVDQAGGSHRVVPASGSDPRAGARGQPRRRGRRRPAGRARRGRAPSPGRVPADPPETDDQTAASAPGLDQEAVDGVLGAPAGVSRTLDYEDRSAVCSWATGTRDPRTVAVTRLQQHRRPGRSSCRSRSTSTVRRTCRASTPATRSRSPAPPTSSPRTGRRSRWSGDFPPAPAARKPLPVTPRAHRAAHQRGVADAVARRAAQTNGAKVGGGSGPVSRSRAAS